MKYKSLFLAACLANLMSQPAIAQDDHVLAVQASDRTPAGFSATVGLRVPLGTERQGERRTTYNITTGYGQRLESYRPGEPERTRRFELAQLNFDSNGARDLQMANLGITQFGRDDIEGPRLNGSTGTALAIVGGVVVVGLAVVFLTLDDDDFNFFEE